jgi:tetratricopeptide (TPR) repeat protein
MLIINRTYRFYILLLFILFIFQSNSCFTQDINKINLANEYYALGDIDKALDLYEVLAKNSKNIPIIHKNYFDLLLSTDNLKTAEKYINNIIKSRPDNIYYAIDKGLLYRKIGDEDKEKNYYKKIFNEIKKDDRKTRQAARYLIGKQKLEYAEELYLLARNEQKDELRYAIELATIYRLLNEKDKMVREYLNFVNKSPNNLPYVRNVLQNYLTETEDLISLENLLFDLIQKDPQNNIYSELLIWVNIQQRNFYGAFIQARAYDIRTGKEGNEIFEVGLIALENKDYETSIEIFDHLINNYKTSYIYPIAKRYKIKSREELVKNTYPVSETEIRNLINDYNLLVVEIGVNTRTAEGLLSKAHLHAFYLDEMDSAITILNTIIGIRRISPELKAKCKLDLGDIYLLKGESWESVLLYAQVEKSRKESPTGYEAKLRSAKLSYYKGEFELAQQHLDVLKLATTREIANDAMHLSLLIKDNIGLDTSDFLMKKYADIELLLFQNKKDQALDSLNSMYNIYKGSSLTDEILWLLTTIYMEMGQFQKVIELLNIIVEDYGDDIFGDDAFFRMAEIYDYQLKNSEMSKKLYQEFLKKYPGSIYAAEARKRFRTLRGDYIN